MLLLVDCLQTLVVLGVDDGATVDQGHADSLKRRRSLAIFSLLLMRLQVRDFLRGRALQTFGQPGRLLEWALTGRVLDIESAQQAWVARVRRLNGLLVRLFDLFDKRLELLFAGLHACEQLTARLVSHRAIVSLHNRAVPRAQALQQQAFIRLVFKDSRLVHVLRIECLMAHRLLKVQELHILKRRLALDLNLSLDLAEKVFLLLVHGRIGATVTALLRGPDPLNVAEQHESVIVDQTKLRIYRHLFDLLVHEI